MSKNQRRKFVRSVMNENKRLRHQCQYRFPNRRVYPAAIPGVAVAVAALGILLGLTFGSLIGIFLR